MLHKGWKEKEGLGHQHWTAKGISLLPVGPQTPACAKPTFVVDATIGVLLARHQLLHFVLCQPLTWQDGRRRLSRHCKCDGSGRMGFAPKAPALAPIAEAPETRDQ